MSKPLNSVYMHTLSGKPAFFHAKEGLLFYASNGQTSLNGNNKLFVNSLDRIRREQNIDLKTMVNKYNVIDTEYKGTRGYLRIRIK